MMKTQKTWQGRSRYLIFAIVICASSLATAAVLPGPVRIKPGHISAPFASGEVIGGQAGEEFSLVGVHREKLPGKDVERLMLSYGDRNGKPQHGEPGYYHVTVDHGARRIIIDLAQVHRTAVGPAQLSQVFASSALVASSEMTMDPADGSTNITLQTKQPVRVKVATVGASHAGVMLEIERVGEVSP